MISGIFHDSYHHTNEYLQINLCNLVKATCTPINLINLTIKPSKHLFFQKKKQKKNIQSCQCFIILKLYICKYFHASSQFSARHFQIYILFYFIFIYRQPTLHAQITCTHNLSTLMLMKAFEVHVICHLWQHGKEVTNNGNGRHHAFLAIMTYDSLCGAKVSFFLSLLFTFVRYSYSYFQYYWISQTYLYVYSFRFYYAARVCHKSNKLYYVRQTERVNKNSTTHAHESENVSALRNNKFEIKLPLIIKMMFQK